MADPISADNKRLAKRLATAFEAKPTIIRYWNDARTLHLDIASSEGHPWPDVTAHGTLGLSDHPMFLNGKEYPVRLELVAACRSPNPRFANLLATVGFHIVTDRWLCHPGAVMMGVVDDYELSSTMQHLYFMPPFLWDAELNQVLDLETKRVTWLLAVPISEAERLYAAQNGSEALERLFEQHDIDIFDLDRESVR